VSGRLNLDPAVVAQGAAAGRAGGVPPTGKGRRPGPSRRPPRPSERDCPKWTAADAAHTVVVSQLLNERFAHEAGLVDGQLGSDPRPRSTRRCRDSLRLELAHAQLVRELLPAAPLKYMPPTKHMTGNVFAGYRASGTFGITKRPADGGKGLDGVVAHADGYLNPAVDLLEEGWPDDRAGGTSHDQGRDQAAPADVLPEPVVVVRARGTVVVP
jgi:hypothetical protein